MTARLDPEPQTMEAFIAALPTWVTADWLIRAALYVDPAGDDETARARAFAYAVRPVTP